jgi:hypothetical protein
METLHTEELHYLHVKKYYEGQDGADGRQEICSRHVRNEKCIQYFGRTTTTEERLMRLKCTREGYVRQKMDVAGTCESFISTYKTTSCHTLKYLNLYRIDYTLFRRYDGYLRAGQPTNTCSITCRRKNKKLCPVLEPRLEPGLPPIQYVRGGGVALSYRVNPLGCRVDSTSCNY